MRAVLIALLGLALTTPAWAQQTQVPSASGGSNAGHNFARVTCLTHVPCSGEYDYSVYVSNANACITQFFGYSSATGFFEDGPLDSGNCLTPKSNVVPQGMGAPMIAQCCMVTQPDNSCTFHCELNTTK
jgi:hypothetical protein